MWREVTDEPPMSCAAIRELDRLGVESLKIPSLLLMENAGAGAAGCILAHFADAARRGTLVLCGPGNNGGDGLVVARLLDAARAPVTVLLAAPPEKLKGDPAVHLEIVQRLGIRILYASSSEEFAAAGQAIAAAGLIVDALLGTGAGGPPRGVVAELIAMANRAAAARVAIDLPSGLDADSGEAAECCFRADATITLAAPKLGFAAPAARRVLGRVFIADIGVTPEQVTSAVASLRAR
ncbi:Bifunctional NAD(P)H-hydrate repair enzyme Nnr [Phycisphaerae bacterium RAS1]|nr:Bifunctional NAD(P)H-hydrate repair enzyme Nnr [Phycisphaerae bacterium RAS1]